MLNYLPLRNVLTRGIKTTVKNKALPDSASTPVWSVCLSVCLSLSLSLPLSLFLADLALSNLVSRVFSLSHQRRSSWGYPLDPAEAGPRQVPTSWSLGEMADPWTRAENKTLTMKVKKYSKRKKKKLPQWWAHVKRICELTKRAPNGQSQKKLII